ncbi:MAG TPA: T9SS type A sorting domain-containing protein, partial [Saprospiraceae bacterium]|nr:T9SS type A sorting domain-containing protein [Saprospiraceae bacterium]
YTVVLTGKDGAGCTGTASVSFSVNPAANAGSITVSDPNPCAGELVTLTATAGTMWMWSTGATTQSITVTSSGTYSVVVKDANGCSASPTPATVTFKPAPPAIISGNSVICDGGCTTLNAPQSSPAYTYEWQTGTGSPLSPPATAFNLMVCANGIPYPPGTYQVVVKDANGCTAVSPDVTVISATPPSFSVSASPTPACAGTPTTLSIVVPQPNVVYSWTNGASGTSTVVTQAGSYQAVGVDTLTGCSFAASAVVNPLPDFCIVPSGCYKVCDPDTICGPDGLAAYQWNLNGAPIPGATNQCLVVTQMGTYSLTGTTSAGCSSTSDSLQLMVMPCDPVCDSISVLVDNAVTPNGDEKPCCFNIVVNNSKPNFFSGIVITALSGGTLPIGNVSAGTGWSVAGFSSPTSVTVKPGSGNPIPLGGGTCAEICLTPTSGTLQVLVEFLDANNATLCDTILELECEHCVEIYDEQILCDTAGTGQYQMSFCVHNANTNTFNANAIVLMGPPGVTFNPAVFSLPNIPPNGSYCSFTTTITVPPGTNLQNFCIGYTIHQQDVSAGLPPKECCMIKECYDLPDCCPHFATATPVDTTDGMCCWKITLNQPPGSATSVTANIIPALSPVSFNGIIPPIAPWTFAYNPPHSITWALASGNPLPANISLPTVCFDVPSGSPVPQQLELVWSSSANDPLCRDTLEFFCRPDTDCVALTPLSQVCSGGQNVYTVVVTNPFGSTLTTTPTHIALVDIVPAGALVGSGIYPVGSLSPGSSAVISITLQGTPGTQVCFALNAYSNPAPNIFIDCCVTDTFCVTLLSCGLQAYLGNLKLYPNPVRANDVTLDFGEGRSPEQGWVRIRDVTGRLLGEQMVPPGIMRHDVELPGLSSGLYFVEFVENGSRVWSQKMSVMR